MESSIIHSEINSDTYLAKSFLSKRFFCSSNRSCFFRLNSATASLPRTFERSSFSGKISKKAKLNLVQVQHFKNFHKVYTAKKIIIG